MKKLMFSEIKNTNFYIDKIASIYQTPSYRSFNSNGRTCNGFVVIEEGECLYSWNGGQQLLKKGSVLYLPYGSVHRMDAITQNLSFTRVDFTTHFENSEVFVFSDVPQVFCTHYDLSVMDMAHEMNKLFLDASAGLKLKSHLYELLDILDGIIHSKNNNPVDYVADYIERHYTENIDFKKLIDQSFLSQATLYRNFKKKFKMTPTEYKNHLRMERAKIMLKSDEYTINEISEFLGFESIYYFSRVFKGSMGYSPKHFKEINNLIVR